MSKYVVTIVDSESERLVVLYRTAEPDAGLAQFLADNVDAPEVWEAVRSILAGECDEASTGGGAAPTTRYLNATTAEARRTILERQSDGPPHDAATATGMYDPEG